MSPKALSFLRVVCLGRDQLSFLTAAAAESETHEQREAHCGARDGSGDERMVECDELDDHDPRFLSGRGARVSTTKTQCDRPLSVQTEQRCVSMLRNILQTFVDDRLTSVEEDSALLARLDRVRVLALGKDGPSIASTTAECEYHSDDIAIPFDIQYDTDAYWRLLSAVNYRLTRKHIIDSVVSALDVLKALLDELAVVSDLRRPALSGDL